MKRRVLDLVNQPRRARRVHNGEVDPYRGQGGERSPAPSPLAFWARGQADETAIHRWTRRIQVRWS